MLKEIVPQDAQDKCVFYFIMATSSFILALLTPIFMRLAEHSLLQYGTSTVVNSIVFYVSIYKMLLHYQQLVIQEQ